MRERETSSHMATIGVSAGAKGAAFGKRTAGHKLCNLRDKRPGGGIGQRASGQTFVRGQTGRRHIILRFFLCFWHSGTIWEWKPGRQTGGVRTLGMEMGLSPKQASIYMAFTILCRAKEGPLRLSRLLVDFFSTRYVLF